MRETRPPTFGEFIVALLPLVAAAVVVGSVIGVLVGVVIAVAKIVSGGLL